MDDIGLELPHGAGDQRQMAQEAEVDAEVPFEGKGQESAPELETGDAGVAEIRLRAIAGAHGEKWEIAPLRKGLELTASMRNSIHFVERVGKISDAHMAKFRCFDPGCL